MSNNTNKHVPDDFDTAFLIHLSMCIIYGTCANCIAPDCTQQNGSFKLLVNCLFSVALLVAD